MTRKNRLPLQQGMLQRPRLHTLIQEGLQSPLLVLLAGPGYGKTQIMANYLAGCSAQVLWLRLGSLDNLCTYFWNHLVRSLKVEAPAIADQLQSMEFPDSPSRFEAFLHILANGPQPQNGVIWVFDDFGEIHDARVKAFSRMLVEAELENFHLVLISNELSSTESIAFMTSKRYLILAKDLRFTREEIAGLYAMYGIPLESAELHKIEHYTEGWPLSVHLLAMQHKEAPAPVPGGETLTHHAITHMFEERFFSAYPKPQQKMLVQLSLLESFSRDFAIGLYEGKKTDLAPLANHVFLRAEPTTGQLFFHHLYRHFLQNKAYLLDAEDERQVWQKAAAYSAATGNTIEAITCYRKCGDHIGALNAILDFIKYQHGLQLQGITPENAAFFLEHLDLLTPEEARENPVSDYLRAMIHLNTLELEKAETQLLDLEKRLLESGTPEANALLGDTYSMLGIIHMMTTREDFGEYHKKALEYLPGGTILQNKAILTTQNNHSFSIPDNKPGARERMERTVHYAVPLIAKFRDGGMSGMEHLFSAESAYLTGRFSEAQQHAWRAIYKAEAHAQHDLVCNGYCILARTGLMQGDYAEMKRQVQHIAAYAAKHESSVLNEIRDTALGWYYIKLQDHSRIPKSIRMPNHSDRPALAHDRTQIVYANYLIQTGEWAKLVGMLEHPTGLYVTSSIWPDRICLFIMLAIGHHYLGNPGAAMEALWIAYDMCHANGLTTLFVEADRHMPVLAEQARQQKTHHFSPAWLDLVSREAAAFAERAAAVRAAYKMQNPPASAAGNPLTRREMDILQALSLGLTREEIALQQFISVNTVKSFIRSIYNKLNASNRAEAISIAISHGYIEISTPGTAP